jgi:thiol-disulfide isomerase/thioredoxin
MGMFDSVYLDKAFCYLCGKRFCQNDEWQTKSGKSLLLKYKSRGEFEKDNPTVGLYKLSNRCSGCGEYINISLRNLSSEHEDYAKAQADKLKETLTRECTSKHPDHEWKGEPYLFWNAWCSKCKELGVSKGDVPPDASRELIEKQKEIRNRPRKQVDWGEFMEEWQEEYEDD